MAHNNHVHSRLGQPIAIGPLTFAGAPFAPEYSVRLRLGVPGSPHVVEHSSEAPPPSPSVFAFNRTTGVLSILLPASDAAALGVGDHHMQFDLVSSVTGVQPAEPSDSVGRLTIVPEIT